MNKSMIFIIFTPEGLQEATSQILHEQADLWVNPDLYETEEVATLRTQGILTFALPEQIDANKEKSVLMALAYVEKQVPKKEIFVEYI